MSHVHGHSAFGFLCLLGIVGLSSVFFGVGLFLSQPSATCAPLLRKRHLCRLLRLEKRLVHGANIGVHEAGVEPVNRGEVSLGAVVDVGESTLVGTLFSDVHFDLSLDKIYNRRLYYQFQFQFKQNTTIKAFS